MKKFFGSLAIVAMVSMLFVACHKNTEANTEETATVEEVVDSVVEDVTVDTVVAE